MAEVYQQSNQDAWKFILDFDPFLLKVYNKLTGRTTKIVMINAEAVKLSNGSVEPQYAAEATRDDNALQIMNDKGAKYVCHHLDFYYNPHSALGDIKNDEAVDIAADAIDAIFDHLYLNSSLYDIGNPSLLMAESQTILQTLYMYLTGVKDSGYKKFGEKTLNVSNSSGGSQVTPVSDMGTMDKINQNLRTR